MNAEPVTPLVSVGTAAEGWCDITTGVCVTPPPDQRFDPHPIDSQQPIIHSASIPAAAEQE